MTERDFMRFLKENNCFYSYLINFTKRKNTIRFPHFMIGLIEGKQI